MQYSRIAAMFIAAWLLVALGDTFSTEVARGAEPSGALLAQVDVFSAGVGGYHSYRIPAVIVTAKGTILAICEGRKNSRADHGDIDLVLRRSSDGGRNWSPLQVIWEEGTETIGNPSPVVDRKTGVIWLPFTRNNDRVFVTKSEDDGRSWSKPREITADVKRPGWTWYATGPGHAVQLKSGRLLIPCDHRESGEPTGNSHSHVIYSDDQGATWRLGGSAVLKTNECTAVQLENGDVYLNMRSYFGKNRRAIAHSRDGGLTWSETTHDAALIEPVCEGSAVRLTDTARFAKSRILFSNPASVRREKLTVRLSYDEAKSWPRRRVLHQGPAAYSDLCVEPDHTVGCLYERGEKSAYEHITYARFNLAWLSGGEDRLQPKSPRP